MKIQVPTLLLTCIFGLFWVATAQVRGFAGFGSTTPGGNNGAVVVVTSLEDAGPGTLREALGSGNNRRIVFDVGGTITLHNRLNIKGQSCITIDGATAPSPGITLAGNTLNIRNSHDIIVTHLRVRHSVDDNISVSNGSSNVIIDHCSLTNAGDENIGITEGTANVTVSWCIIGDTRPNSFALHSKGMLIANFDRPPVTHVSLHHNLFINENQRRPQIDTAGLFDLRNNVIWDWGVYGIRMRLGAMGNIINNVFDSATKPHHAIVLVADGILDASYIYIQGNQGPKGTDVNALSTLAAPFPVAPVTTDPVTEVKQKVLQMAGAFPRDNLDMSLAKSVMAAPSGASDEVAVSHTPPTASPSGVAGLAKDMCDGAVDAKQVIADEAIAESERTANDP
jgi:pectate lyase